MYRIVGLTIPTVRPIIKYNPAVPEGPSSTWATPQGIESAGLFFCLGRIDLVFCRNELVGGLYGVSLGAAFFGESMFFTMSNASKVAFHALVEHCGKYGLKFIDCQVETSHLLGLGATLVDRKDYLLLLEESLKAETIQGKWVL